MGNRHIRHYLRHFIIWTWALIFWNLMRFLGQEVVLDHAPYTIMTLIQLHLSVGIIASLLFGSLDYCLKTYVLRKVSFARALLIGSLGYLVTALLLVTFGIFLFVYIQDMRFNWVLYYSNIFTSEVALLVFYCFQVGFAINFIQEIDKKLGPGNLVKMLKGKFYTPTVDNRIFMFLDLKSSTNIAERIGHLRFSELLQDCFKDLDVIEQYQAEIYQYVGDEVVLTWPEKVGLENSNCISTFFEFQQKLRSKSDYYKNKYGLVPQFKAGLNTGEIVVAEVGEIKSEIAYHGDTINTAARIQGVCNKLGRDVLVSGALKSKLQKFGGIQYNLLDEILLRGKETAVEVYGVELV